MDDRADEPGRQVQVLEVQPGTAHFEQVLILAVRVLAWDRHLASRIPHARGSHVLDAFDGTLCTGFLRYLIQVIGTGRAGPGTARWRTVPGRATSRPSESTRNAAAE